MLKAPPTSVQHIFEAHLDLCCCRQRAPVFHISADEIVEISSIFL
jgi:hypothetical protein